MTSILELAKNTKEEIKNLEKPLSAYQYYTKAMRERWTSLNEAEKEEYIYKAEQDKHLYEAKKDEIKEIERNETRKLKIYYSRTHGRVPCVG